jgi:hypothetical protein
MKATTTVLLSDDALVAEIKRLLRAERLAISDLVVHLADMDRRDIHLAAGFSSLYTYCVGALGFSEYEAYSRIEVARAGTAFPRIFLLLSEGALTLTTVQLLARRLTVENHDRLLTAARRRTKREVQELLAGLFPQADVADSIRRVPRREASVAPSSAITTPADIPRSAPIETTTPVAGPASGSLVMAESQSAVSAPRSAAPASSRAVEISLTPDRYHVTFTATAETCALLREAKDRLGHAVPDGSTDQVVNRALKALLAQLDGTRHAATEKPRPPRGTAPRSRTAPAHVKRAVWQRDGGTCAFVAASGRRCGERRFLEYHHLDPYALGGEATIHGVALRCRSHNSYEARLWGLARPDDTGQARTRSGPSSTPDALPGQT